MGTTTTTSDMSESNREDVMSQEELTVTEEPDLEHLIQENQNLKKKLGDQGNEIGQLRKAVDGVLQQQVTQAQDDDLYLDPVEKELSNVKQELHTVRAEQRMRDLESKHPGFRDLPENEAFAHWLGNSNYRQTLYHKANAMDFDAAEELLTAWEENQETANQAHEQAKSVRNQNLKAASMEKGSAGGGRKTYYSRGELINLRINNPQKYQAMLPEIKQAYMEGRVRK